MYRISTVYMGSRIDGNCLYPTIELAEQAVSMLEAADLLNGWWFNYTIDKVA
jgi:hypothetical protein